MNPSYPIDIEPKLLDLPAKPKILLIRLSALGDIIQTLPILPLIRKAQPDAHIGWAIDSDFVASIQGHRDIDQIHPFQRKKWSKSLSRPSEWGKTLNELDHFFKEIQSVGYDVALDVQGLFKTGLLTYLSGAKHRVGFAHKREGCGIFYQHAYLNRKQYHHPHLLHVDHMALLTRTIGAKEEPHTVDLPPVSAAVEQKVTKLLTDKFLNDKSIVVIAPGTQWESKLWREKNWIELVKNLIDRSAFNIVFVGAPGDKELVGRIVSQLPPSERILNLAGQTNIPELYALCGQVQALVACDSAPLHIAGAAHVPHVFGIFGPTAKARTAPIGSPNTVIFSSEDELNCQPCHKRVCPLGTGECLERVTPQAISNALIDTVPQSGAVKTIR